MNDGKSTVFLQEAQSYLESGMQVYLLTAHLDDRAATGQIGSRIGIVRQADPFSPGLDLFGKVVPRLEHGKVACVFLDEAQFLEAEQVWQLVRVVDDLDVPVMCQGLRVDFRGSLFPANTRSALRKSARSEFTKLG